jgi:electron transfer flavoprotein alpha subunit
MALPVGHDGGMPPLHVAVLVKQVPSFEELRLGPDGRLLRDGLELEMNTFCRRAVNQGMLLARGTGGRCTVLTLGPPAAEDALREAIAWGVDDGVLITDPAFAGSDTLATARALAAALELLGPFDVVLAGRNSVDADTGQVGPELAELLGLPILAGVRTLELDGRRVRVRCELDDGWSDAEVDLPALLTCAERLCEPAKVKPEGRAAVAADRIRRLSAADLGPGPWGAAGSPTSVGDVRVLEVERRQLLLSGPVEDQVREAASILDDAGALGATTTEGNEGAVADGWERGDRRVAVIVEPARPRVARELLGAAARLACRIGGRVVAVAAPPAGDMGDAGAWGADDLVELRGSMVEEDVATAVAGWCEAHSPWAVLVPGTMWGREVASRVAARLGAGLTGDAVDLDVGGASDNGHVDDAHLIGWKPAFGGGIVAAITASSPVQMATARPGVLPLTRPRPARRVPVTVLDVPSTSRVRLLGSGRDDDIDVLGSAGAVVGVGTGVPPEEYPLLDPLLELLGGELGATRKVTDRGWMPRARQIGITGRSISPNLYVAIGVGGKFNHMVGVRAAGMIVAINQDPNAPVFGVSDIGIVGDWHEIVPLLVDAIAALARDRQSA